MAEPESKSTQIGGKGVTRRSAEQDLRDRLGLPYAARLGRDKNGSWRDRLFDALKTFLWVAPLTILIWIYAEREQLATLPDLRIPIQVRTDSPDLVVTLLSPEDQHVTVELQGPRASLDRIRDSLSAGRPVVLTIPPHYAPGFEEQIPVADLLARHPVFAQEAINIVRVRPPTIRVRVERKAARQVPIRQHPDEKIVGEVVFEPDSVTIEGPERLLDAIPPEQLVVYADMSKFANLPPGRYSERVSLSFPGPSLNVTLLPRSVMAAVELKPSEPYQITSIPIFVEMPARILEIDRYRIQPPLTLANVTVTGPPGSIQLLEEGGFVPKAVVQITSEDLVSPGEKIKRLTAQDYVMPVDVSVTNPDREVRITISER